MGNEPGSGGFFRFRRSAIDRIVADRELMVRQAENRAEEAEERLRELEREVKRLQGGNGSASHKNGGSQVPPQELVHALSGAIESAAEKIAARQSGGSSAGPQEPPREARPSADEAWKILEDPAIGAARESLESIRDALRMLPKRLEEALSPLARSVREADEALAKLESPHLDRD